MKKLYSFVLCFAALVATPVFSQPAEKTEKAAAAQPHPLTKFDLDFRGGTPAELVAAIEKARGRSLNAIVSPEHAQRPLPPLKMKNVNVVELFQALESATASGGRSGPTRPGYGFRSNRVTDDDAIWSFYDERQIAPRTPQKVTRFYFAHALPRPWFNGGRHHDRDPDGVAHARRCGDPNIELP